MFYFIITLELIDFMNHCNVFYIYCIHLQKLRFLFCKLMFPKYTVNLEVLESISFVNHGFSFGILVTRDLLVRMYHWKLLTLRPLSPYCYYHYCYYLWDNFSFPTCFLYHAGAVTYHSKGNTLSWSWSIMPISTGLPSWWWMVGLINESIVSVFCVTFTCILACLSW